MTNVGKTLFKLQQIDLTLRKNKSRLDEIQQLLANDASVKRAQKLLEQAENILKPLQVNLRDLELQVQSTKQKREASENRLYSGNVSNPKELQEIEQNIASLKRWQSELEDKQLELMLEVEDANASFEQAQENLQVVSTKAAANNQELLAEKQSLEAETKMLRENRVEVVSELDEVDVALYEKMKPQMAFRPISVLSPEGHCTICGVQQINTHAQAIRRSDELMRCANCNRILIAE